MWQQIAAEQPNFVTHGGDISYANECGWPAAPVLERYRSAATRRYAVPLGHNEYGGQARLILHPPTTRPAIL